VPERCQYFHQVLFPRFHRIDPAAPASLVGWIIELAVGLANTLRSRSRRGCQFRIRPKGDYTNSQGVYLIKNKDGKECGEWSCGGGDKGA
jgi:hypothetical protein